MQNLILCFLCFVISFCAGSPLVAQVRINSQHHDNFVRAQASLFSDEFSCNPKRGSLRPKDLEVLGFAIGSSTIRDVQKRFPKTSLVRLTEGEEADSGICIKNNEGMAVVFVTGVMGAPDTIVSIYLAPTTLVENSQLRCASGTLPSKRMSSASGIRVGAASNFVAKIVRGPVPSSGQFCAAYEIESNHGPLRISKAASGKRRGFTDFTGVGGQTHKGIIQWVKLFGIASN